MKLPVFDLPSLAIFSFAASKVVEPATGVEAEPEIWLSLEFKIPKYLSCLGIIFFLALALFSHRGYADEMTITAEKVTCDKLSQTCVAETDVKVVQKNEKKPSENQTLNSDTLKLTFSKDNSKKKDASDEGRDLLGSGKIESIEAKDNVLVIYGDIKITAQYARYTAQTNVIEFFGDVVIEDTKNKAISRSPYASLNRTTGKYEIKAVPIANLPNDMDTSGVLRKERVHIIVSPPKKK